MSLKFSFGLVWERERELTGHFYSTVATHTHTHTHTLSLSLVRFSAAYMRESTVESMYILPTGMVGGHGVRSGQLKWILGLSASLLLLGTCSTPNMESSAIYCKSRSG